MPNRDEGYTLIELLVVMGILALIASLAVPVAGWVVDGVMLRTDARALVVAVRRIEARAIAGQETISLTSSEGKLVGPSGDAVDLPDGSDIQFTGGTGRIEFYPDGTSSGGHVTVSHANRSLQIDIAWLSGDVAAADEQ
jgi:general secretion pathway protein H